MVQVAPVFCTHLVQPEGASEAANALPDRASAIAPRKSLNFIVVSCVLRLPVSLLSLRKGAGFAPLVI
jgi:hypothetical protein